MLGHCEICGQSFSHGQTHWQCYANREAYIQARKQYYLESMRIEGSQKPQEHAIEHLKLINKLFSSKKHD